MGRQEIRQLLEEIDVVSENLPNSGALDFYNDVASVAKLRGVNLSKRCTAERLVVKRCEQLADLCAKLFLYDSLDFLEIHRRNAVLQSHQLFDVGW